MIKIVFLGFVLNIRHCSDLGTNQLFLMFWVFIGSQRDDLGEIIQGQSQPVQKHASSLGNRKGIKKRLIMISP